MTTISDRIKQARKKAGLTQTAVSKHFGVSREAVSQWESPKNSTIPRKERLIELARLLNVNIAWLMIGDENTSYAQPDDIAAGNPHNPHLLSGNDLDLNLVRVSIIGEICAFRFQRNPVSPDGWKEFSLMVSRDNLLSEGDLFGFVLADTSLNQRWRPGTILICTAIKDIPKGLQENDFVIAENWRNGYAELIARQYKTRDGQSYLWPLSDHLDFQAPLPCAPPITPGAEEAAVEFDSPGETSQPNGLKIIAGVVGVQESLIDPDRFSGDRVAED